VTIQQTLAEGKKLLESPSDQSFIDTPSLDAALLLAEVLHIDRTELFVRGNDPLSEQDRKQFFHFIERRKSGECIAYILGRREFRGLLFNVNPDTLVPRPDTETLVEAALEYINTHNTKNESGSGAENFSVLDLCSGSGAIAISLKSECPFLSITASDISAGALETARLNAERLLDYRFLDGQHHSIKFVQSDLFENIPGRFNIIVSNPPYIPSDDIAALAPEVRREPRLALDGGRDGLDLIRKIISRSPQRLAPDGHLILEADPRQMQDILKLLEKQKFTNIRIRKDLAGRDRVIEACMLSNSIPYKKNPKKLDF